MPDRRSPWLLLAPLALLGGPGCSSGGGGSNAGTTSFQVSDISVDNGSVWEINREIVLVFTEPVDFGTVSANTINIRSVDDVPATGVFELRDALTVVFQPSCPTRDDLSDAGLQAGGVTYVLRVHGLDSSANTVRSVTGVPVGVQQVRTFTTPASSQASVAFQDTRSGPPDTIVRDQGSADEEATYLEIGGDPDQRVYFEHDASGDLVLSIPGFEVPLNLYSDPASRVAVVIAFDQPVNPSSSNISESRLRLEFLDSSGSWRAIDTRATLVANCTETGALVRLEPRGVLPPSSSFRAVLLAGFQDLVGEPTPADRADFAEAPTRAVQFTSLTPSDLLSDELNEGYDFGGESPLSLEDEEALFDSPRAVWGDGELSAAFAFEGTGGPNGDFDWIVRDGEIFFFDTVSTLIIGGPNGVPTTTVTAVNGVVDVRHLTVQAGGEIRVQGPKTMRINATGDVRIDGRIELSGFAAKDVATLNTGNQVEIGGSGAGGGGRGGHANENVTNSTPRGGNGQGPFGQVDVGGQGGESGFSPESNPKDSRRPGGGGGGRFARIWSSDETAECSLQAWKGHDGHLGPSGGPSSTGAVTGQQPALGGEPGLGPFLDTSSENDFFGVKPVVSGGELVALVRGELPDLWAGYGGGGGGNACPANRFPTPNWNFGSDEKGGGGGGGGGGLHVKALGRIVFGPAGEIWAKGARGGTGENTNLIDHVGGTGGGGSGGHVILESATRVDFTDGGLNVGADLRDWLVACGPPVRKGSLGDVPACCKGDSNGGAGSAGVIQVHVPRSTAPPSDDPLLSDIVVPTEALIGDPLDNVSSPPIFAMIPTFGARSKARSEWISIGGADQGTDGSEDLVRFLFAGIETAPGTDEGKILAEDDEVTALVPLASDADLASSTTARILADGFTLELTGAALAAIRAGTTTGVSNDVYLRTPALLEGCSVRMVGADVPSSATDYSVASAAYDEGTAAPGDEALRVTVTTEKGPLSEYNSDGLFGATGFQLLPRFFQVVTTGHDDLLPDTAFVRILFQAAADDGSGAPDEGNPLVNWTADIARFNALPAGALQFFRYEVEFFLAAGGGGVTEDTEPVTLDFLKVPFVF